MATRTRNQVVAFRVTPAERRQINAKVRRSGLSQQKYLLKSALNEPIYVMEELKPILSELRAWGKNLNQLTTLAHQGRVQTAYLQELTAALGRTYEAVSKLTEKGPVIHHGREHGAGNPVCIPAKENHGRGGQPLPDGRQLCGRCGHAELYGHQTPLWERHRHLLLPVHPVLLPGRRPYTSSGPSDRAGIGRAVLSRL